MKNIIVILLFTIHCSLFTLVVDGQMNLVLNSGFEQYIGKCTDGVILNNCTGSTINYWYSPNAWVPGWFNYCYSAYSLDEGVPSNYFGYQFPHSGQAYAEMTSQDQFSYRVYLVGQLSEKLIQTKKYCVNFYVSLCDSDCYASSAIGLYFSNDSICAANTPGILPYIPQIENPLTNIITDKKDWIPISGEYLAKGGEHFITIGDFYNDTNTHYTFVGGGGQNFSCKRCGIGSDYYIDDISVREITFANASITTTLGSSSLTNRRDTTICNGQSIIIGGDTAVPGVSYQWLPTEGLQNPNAAQTVATPSVSTTYTLIVHNDSMFAWNCLGKCNCPDSVNRDSVTIYVITVNGKACCDTSITTGQSVQLSASGGTNYIWQPLTACNTCPNPMVNPSQTTVFTVTISEDTGISATLHAPCSVQRTLTVDVSCGQVFIPTAFSPGGGFGYAQPSHNNILYVRGACIKTMDFVIFDRWGNKVFESERLEDGWDGTYKGQAMNIGTYTWYLKATMEDGSSLERRGNVTLVR